MGADVSAPATAARNGRLAAPSIVVKRDGSEVRYSRVNVWAAVAACFRNQCGMALDEAEKLAGSVADQVERVLYGLDRIGVEKVQDIVEQQLMALGHHEAAREYILYREQRRQVREEQAAKVKAVDPEVRRLFKDSAAHFTGINRQLQVAQHFDKFSRFQPALGRRETWPESVGRVMTYTRKHAEANHPGVIDEATWAELEAGLLRQEATPSMRLVQMAGPSLDRCQVGVYNCLGRETEFVTSVGVRSFRDFEDGDTVTVLTHRGRWRQAVVRCYGRRALHAVTIGRGRSKFTVRATRDHRWILRDGGETTALKVGDKLATPPTPLAAWRYEDADPHERLYWAYGFAFGDGSLQRDSGGNPRYTHVRLVGAKARFLPRFEELGFESSRPLSCGGDPIVYTGAYTKTLPDPRKDRVGLLVAFVRGLLDADGVKVTSGANANPFRAIQQTGDDAVAFVRKVFPAAGAYVTREEDLTGQETNFGARKDTTVLFGIVAGFGDAPNSPYSCLEISPEGVIEDVWCLEVEEDRSFVLPSGIVTGNCSFLFLDEPRAYAEDLYCLMQGTGVGFSVEHRHAVDKWPRVKKQRGHKPDRYVIPDTTEGWCDALKDGLARWLDGGDYEFDDSLIRAEGTPLKTKGGRASGPRPLRELLTFARAKVLARQGDRLASLDLHDMACMSHRIVQMGGVRRASGISFSDLDDALMRDAKSGPFWNTAPYRNQANNSAVYDEKPSSVEFMEEWLSLARSGSGERGIFNYGGLKKQLPRRRKRALMRANPCVTADTWVTTAEGPRQVKDLVGVPFAAVVDGELHTATGFFKTGTKAVRRLTLDNGMSLRVTGNHKILVVTRQTRRTQRTAWRLVDQLRPGDRVVLHNHRGLAWEGVGTFKEGWLLGNMVGDGSMTTGVQGRLDYWGEHRDEMLAKAVERLQVAVACGPTLKGSRGAVSSRVNSRGLAKLAESFGLTGEAKTPTAAVEGASSAFCEGFLRGWFDADGSVQGTQQKGVSVRLASSDLAGLRRAQRMLARLGVASKVYMERRPAGPRELPDGKGGTDFYECQADHELVIANDNLGVFAERVGFDDPSRRLQLDSALAAYRRRLNRERFCSEVAAIADDGVEDVYDCSVPGVNAFDANGLYVHNCGEINLRHKQFCVSADTLLITRDGITRIDDAVGREVEVWNGRRWSKVTPFKTGEDVELYRVRFSDGSHLDVTGYHGFSVSNVSTRHQGRGFERKTTLELAATVRRRWGTEPFRIEHEGGEDVPVETAYDLGVAVGDGCRIGDRAGIDLYGAKRDCPVRGNPQREYTPAGYAVSKERVLCGADVATVDELYALKEDPDALLPLFSWSRRSILAFLAGWADADGSETGTGGIRLYLADRRRASLVQLLLTKCGIRSSVCLHRLAGTEMNYGVWGRDSYYVQVTACDALPCHRLDTSRGHAPRIKGKFQTIRGVEKLPGLHASYCFTEPETHKGVFGNTLTYQCNLSIAVLRPGLAVDEVRRRVRLATIWGTIQSTMTRFNYLSDEWRKNCEEERLLGVDLLGHLDWEHTRPGAAGRDELLASLRDGVIAENAALAARLGINASAAVTCGKPSGNSSAFFDCAAGFKPHHGQHYIRRIRMTRSNPVAMVLAEAGVPHAEDYDKSGLLVFDFPCRAPEGGILLNQQTAIEQLENWKAFKLHWTEHNPSITVYVREDEWLDVGHWVYKNWDIVGGLSFLPYFGGNYPLAPYETITAEEYEQRAAAFPEVDWARLTLFESSDMTELSREFACTGGACEI